MHDLFDAYMPPFETAVRLGGVRGVMCSYNAVNGVPACMSPFLRDVLRRNWSFRGYVASDTDCIAAQNEHPY
eukprot:gene40459-45223_t